MKKPTARTPRKAVQKRVSAKARANIVVDTVWLHDRLRDAGLSMRQVSKRMGFGDVSSLSRRLSGLNATSPAEASDLAHILGVDAAEVARRLGMALAERIAGGDTPIVGMVDPSGLVGSPSGMVGPRKAERPAGTPDTTVGLRVRSPGGLGDGWILFYAPTTLISPEAVGRLCVVQGVDDVRRVGVLNRGYTPWRYTVAPLAGAGAAIDEIMLRWAAPVLWIKP